MPKILGSPALSALVHKRTDFVNREPTLATAVACAAGLTDFFVAEALVIFLRLAFDTVAVTPSISFTKGVPT